MIYRPASYIERLDLADLFGTEPRPSGSDLFPSAQPLEVEIGSGDGSFLVAWAKANPHHNFIGIERLLGRIRKIERKARRAALTNVALMRIEAFYFLEYLLPRNSVSALHIYFPDPWPKRKHRKNRLINENFAELCKRVMTAGGAIYLRTDDPDYFSQMQSVFNGFASSTMPSALSDIVTDFEREFHKRGVATLSAAYKLE